MGKKEVIKNIIVREWALPDGTVISPGEHQFIIETDLELLYMGIDKQLVIDYINSNADNPDYWIKVLNQNDLNPVVKISRRQEEQERKLERDQKGIDNTILFALGEEYDSNYVFPFLQQVNLEQSRKKHICATLIKFIQFTKLYNPSNLVKIDCYLQEKKICNKSLFELSSVKQIKEIQNYIQFRNAGKHPKIRSKRNYDFSESMFKKYTNGYCLYLKSLSKSDYSTKAILDYYQMEEPVSDYSESLLARFIGYRTELYDLFAELISNLDEKNFVFNFSSEKQEETNEKSTTKKKSDNMRLEYPTAVEISKEIVKCLSSGQDKHNTDIYNEVSKAFNLSKEQLDRRLENGRLVFKSLYNSSTTQLRNSGILERVGKDSMKLSAKGIKALNKFDSDWTMAGPIEEKTIEIKDEKELIESAIQLLNQRTKVKGLSILAELAEQGSSEACHLIGTFLLNEKRISSTERHYAYYYLEEAGNSGLVEDYMVLAKELLKREWYSYAVKILKKAADCGLKEAIIPLASCYIQGNGTDVNYESAIELLDANQYSSDICKISFSLKKIVEWNTISETKGHLVFNTNKKNQLSLLLKRYRGLKDIFNEEDESSEDDDDVYDEDPWKELEESFSTVDSTLHSINYNRFILSETGVVLKVNNEPQDAARARHDRVITFNYAKMIPEIKRLYVFGWPNKPILKRQVRQFVKEGYYARQNDDSYVRTEKAEIEIAVNPNYFWLEKHGIDSDYYDSQVRVGESFQETTKRILITRLLNEFSISACESLKELLLEDKKQFTYYALLEVYMRLNCMELFDPVFSGYNTYSKNYLLHSPAYEVSIIQSRSCFYKYIDFLYFVPEMIEKVCSFELPFEICPRSLFKKVVGLILTNNISKEFIDGLLKEPYEKLIDIICSNSNSDIVISE